MYVWDAPLTRPTSGHNNSKPKAVKEQWINVTTKMTSSSPNTPVPSQEEEITEISITHKS